MESILYVISISLQVSGALLLIIKWWQDKSNLLIKEFYSPRVHIGEEKDKENIEVIVYEEDIKDIFINIYINRMAFLYILIGYILNVFGSVLERKICMAMVIFMVSIILTIITNDIIIRMAEKESRREVYKEYIKNNTPEGASVMVLLK